ncbi:hypothetical protein D8674_026790 [Pyrus ussuriensis x Pyrus communis]|uniref:DUF632 domain-containing protein n=1 Tax=Pyrus ussuriensis x Pyrus communis TaxID=2448454 RepID=A0A5N5I7V7_9ROSA|nr:hypothetical protein D8674_026790 [Pyrus ussuriensis x Pyrus communis]
MGGCVASKLEEEGGVVTICRERKRQLKLAVQKRYALAEAHCKYGHALFAVAAAVDFFVAGYSSPPKPYLITFSPDSPPQPPESAELAPLPITENVITNPMFLQQRPSESTHEAIACHSCGSSTSSNSSEEEREEEERKTDVREEQGCGYFYMQMPPAMPSPQTDFGWDFFNPFDVVRPEVISGYRRSSDEDLRVVREEEGIPELEEEEGESQRQEEQEENKAVVVEEKGSGEQRDGGAEVVKVVEEVANAREGEQKGLAVINTPAEGRELLEALKDIVDLLSRASDSAKDVSRMLDANKLQMQSGLEEIKENSTKLIQAITWHNSTSSSKLSSCKSLVASRSKGSSTWTEFNNDLFNDYGGMDSGSHSLTLERLYAWEKKLYEEVKAGDMTRKLYEKKCSRLKHHDIGDNETMDKTRAAVKDLYARILIAIRSAESISKRIQILRDEELQPQIVELLKGLMHTWKIMLESHETQHKILSEVKSFAGSAYGKFSNISHMRATLQLLAELQNWHACFKEYVAAQKAYVETLHGWLTKFVVPEENFYSGSRSSAVPFGVNGPPLLIICHDWLSSMEKLPDTLVTIALRSFTKDVRALLNQQGEEQKQKRKVDSLAKELDRRIRAFQKTESRFLEPKLTEQKCETDMEHKTKSLTEKKEQIDMFRRKVDMEREKHQNYVEETQRITLNGIQTGFCSVFESLAEFSRASQKLYSDLVTCSENADKAGKPSYIEGSTKDDENSSR